MPIFDNLAKAAKEFFVEDDAAAPAAAAVPAPLPAPAPLAAPAAGAPAQAEQRHLDHVAQLLADDHDFGAYLKIVKSLTGSGMAGPLLYQTAFNAYSAVTGHDLPALLASADRLAQTLADDRARVLARHRQKLGETAPPPGTPPSALAQLAGQEAQLQATVADLTRQLAERSQQLATAQQALAAERQKAQGALASYEVAQAAAAAEVQAHRHATQSFLVTSASDNPLTTNAK
ncbi:hypothetical protein [Hymenobacter sp. PAMC 26628]|uniref:hypothetical protein n=1 Tax=Hymenobacter sp. PAMC 26628 TaxID=1484118 RepID=UPI0007705D6E|nr:hypothetical protein [Hymenobacter sp. PAMC 26628]AMJ65194.1 hypothetical protein AXW84_06965 [Hymenobacter sp. PAMC 26628]